MNALCRQNITLLTRERHLAERVCYLTPNKQCSVHLGENRLHFNEMMRVSALYQINTLSFIFQCQHTETTICEWTCRSSWTHYHHSEPASHCSYSLILDAQRKSSKCQFYSHWIDPTRSRTHHLLHSRRTRQSLHHRCDLHHKKAKPK